MQNYSNKKIFNLCILPASFPIGPVEGFLHDELRALASLEHKLLVIPLRPRGLRPRNLPMSECIGYEITSLFSLDVFINAILGCLTNFQNIFFWIKKISSIGKLNQRMKNIAVLPKAIWLSRMLQRKNIHHLHAHWASTTATCSMIAADLAGIPWSMTCHRWDIYENNLLAEKSRRASFVRFISGRGIVDAESLGVEKTKARLIHMGVNIPIADFSVEKQTFEEFRIICAANLIPIKGHKYLLDAIAILKNSNHNIELYLAGNGELMLELKAQVIKLGLEHIVHFLGHLHHDDLIEEYRNRRFQMFVLPSVDLGNGEHEGIPVSIMEAIAYGMPAISTQTGSIEELLPPQFGFTVPHKNSPALAKLISRIASDTAWRDRCIAEQKELLKEWTCDNSAKKLIAAISESF